MPISLLSLYESSLVLSPVYCILYRCCVCQTPLPESYYAVDDQPYCMEHFYETSAHKCQACGTYITGPTMVSGRQRERERERERREEGGGRR